MFTMSVLYCNSRRNFDRPEDLALLGMRKMSYPERRGGPQDHFLLHHCDRASMLHTVIEALYLMDQTELQLPSTQYLWLINPAQPSS